ncbi:hypothetical protein BDN70DRAFT_566424 [Pholiota conissans]|uniref:Uncharacterized protein n=1 Tax=Pholiota conissans TaxID=109636 RepID=A0A9P6D271_9AGAR|nr:hypothetical protein BDN70DRAFT_566424 [Pholiota conissans]
MEYLNDGLERLDRITQAGDRIEAMVSDLHSYDDFIQPAQWTMRQKYIVELWNIVNALDIPIIYDPIRCMLWPFGFTHADRIRFHLSQIRRGKAEPDWRTIWDGRKYIRHILASKALADRFEEGGEVDSSMYDDILR